MFNAEKLLGGMLGGAMRQNLGGGLDSGLGKGLARSLGKGSIGGSGKAAIGLGILGVAFAAAEHFMQNQQQPQAAPPPPSPPGQNTQPPPSPPHGASATAPPPPPPGAAPSPAKKTQQALAVLLIQAMIASAHADGVLDKDERSHIMGRLEALELDDEERQFMERELSAPRSVEEIATEAASLQAQRDVFAAALMAVTVDTPEEEAHLMRLKSLLGLSDDEAMEIAREMGF